VTWEDTLRDVHDCLRRARAEKRDEVRAELLADALQGLADITEVLAMQRLPAEPDRDVGL
jgi:hypothetical protein